MASTYLNDHNKGPTFYTFELKLNPEKLWVRNSKILPEFVWKRPFILLTNRGGGVLRFQIRTIYQLQSTHLELYIFPQCPSLIPNDQANGFIGRLPILPPPSLAHPPVFYCMEWWLTMMRMSLLMTTTPPPYFALNSSYNRNLLL